LQHAWLAHADRSAARIASHRIASHRIASHRMALADVFRESSFESAAAVHAIFERAFCARSRCLVIVDQLDTIAPARAGNTGRPAQQRSCGRPPRVPGVRRLKTEPKRSHCSARGHAGLLRTQWNRDWR
jgi:hypothetical protein